jgi:hypothetical protein
MPIFADLVPKNVDMKIPLLGPSEHVPELNQRKINHDLVMKNEFNCPLSYKTKPSVNENMLVKELYEFLRFTTNF